ncbi:MAG: Ig-like domain-containing protein [Acidimicrobiales bacterium]
MSSKSWIIIKGFTITGTVGAGISLSGSSNVTIESNTVSFAGQPALDATRPGISLTNSTTASLVVGNVTRNNSDHGISLSASSGNEVRNNDSYGNARGISRAAAGIFLRNSLANTVTGNRTHDNEDSGIGLWDGSNSSLVSNNVIYGNGDHGIDVLGSTGETIVSNTVYNSVDSGIEMQGGAGANLVNNVLVDNGIDSPRTSGNIRVVDSGSAALTTLDHDQLHLSSGNILIDYVGTEYSSLSAFHAATGQELNGKQGDPKFKDAASADFHLLASSPAVDSANSGATGQPATDADGVARVDAPGTPNTGVGPRSYDDRGAYELAVAPNGPPVALNEAATTVQDTAVAVAVLTNDSDPDNDPLNVTGASEPAHGTAMVNVNNTITYAPAAGYAGADSFTYSISDGRGGSASATVSMTVTPGNHPPVAVDDTATTAAGNPVSVTVLANDSDPDSDPLTVTGASVPAHGAVVTTDNTVTYTPAIGYSGTDSFTYTISDGRGATATATVRITIAPANLVGNPGFEVDTSGWQGGAASTALTRVAGGHSGGFAAQLSTSTATTQCAIEDKPNWVAVTESGAYTTRVWVRSTTPGLAFKLRVREFRDGILVGSVTTTITPTTTWQEVTAVITPVTPGLSTLDVGMYTTATPVGTCFQADDISITR